MIYFVVINLGQMFASSCKGASQMHSSLDEDFSAITKNSCRRSKLSRRYVFWKCIVNKISLYKRIYASMHCVDVNFLELF